MAHSNFARAVREDLAAHTNPEARNPAPDDADATLRRQVGIPFAVAHIRHEIGQLMGMEMHLLRAPFNHRTDVVEQSLERLVTIAAIAQSLSEGEGFIRAEHDLNRVSPFWIAVAVDIGKQVMEGRFMDLDRLDSANNALFAVGAQLVRDALRQASVGEIHSGLVRLAALAERIDTAIRVRLAAMHEPI